MCHAVKKRLIKIKIHVEWDSNHRPGALRVMAAYTFIFYTLLLMNRELYRLVKIKFVFLKDTSFILSASPISMNAHTAELTVCQKLRTDRQLFSFI